MRRRGYKYYRIKPQQAGLGAPTFWLFFFTVTNGIMAFFGRNDGDAGTVLLISFCVLVFMFLIFFIEFIKEKFRRKNE